MMRKSTWVLFLFSLAFLNCLQAAPDIKSDPLQLYRDEIKQSEANASQAVLDQLKASANANPEVQANSSSDPQLTPAPHSNRDKAFAIPSPDIAKNNPTPPTSNANPWLQPNPWANAAKVNPWANAPIPGPSPLSTAPTHAAAPNPPNIFAPPHTSNP